MFLEKNERDESLKLIKPIGELRETLLSTPMVVAYSTRERPNGEINGKNRDFLLTYEPVNASEHVYLNGLLQEYGQEFDYILNGNHLIFCSAPVIFLISKSLSLFIILYIN